MNHNPPRKPPPPPPVKTFVYPQGDGSPAGVVLVLIAFALFAGAVMQCDRKKHSGEPLCDHCAGYARQHAPTVVD